MNYNSIQTNVRKKVLTNTNKRSIIIIVNKIQTSKQEKTRPHHTNGVGAPLIMDGSTYIQTNSLTRMVENLT